MINPFKGIRIEFHAEKKDSKKDSDGINKTDADDICLEKIDEDEKARRANAAADRQEYWRRQAYADQMELEGRQIFAERIRESCE
jgi:hypothetical protein